MLNALYAKKKDIFLEIAPKTLRVYTPLEEGVIYAIPLHIFKKIAQGTREIGFYNRRI